VAQAKRTLQLGTRVFYPAHGVAVVIGVEERDFGGSPQLFFALELERGDKVLLPVGNVEKAGVRNLVSEARARQMLQRVSQEPLVAEATSRRQRVAGYKDCLRTGAPDSYTDVLQALLFRARTKQLSTEERQVLEEARGYFVAEVSAVLEMRPSEIFDQNDG